jgi:Ca2+/Na+ antiporter
VTEQVAEHTNGTIGALLNATFGNAPELLIASAALRKGFYRVVQLAMLGSMLTNLLFVFGVSCLIGGFRWQVQELRITSGNVSVGMLLLSVAGSLLPATLVLGGQLKHGSGSGSEDGTDTLEEDEDIPSLEELQFCRVNAFVMIFMYGCYLIFQLGTHKEEFDEDDNIVQTAGDHELHLSPHFTSRHGRQQKARRNIFCIWLVRKTKCFLRIGNENDANMAEDGWMSSPALMAENEVRGGGGDVEMMFRDNNRLLSMIPSEHERTTNQAPEDSSTNEECLLPQNNALLHKDENDNYFDDYANVDNSNPLGTDQAPRLRRGGASNTSTPPSHKEASSNGNKKKKTNGGQRPILPLGLAESPYPIERGP